MKNLKKFENFQEDIKTYELGDKYSSDFDYDGMLQAVLDITEETSEEDVEKIYKSLVDVNYHNEARMLGKYLESKDVDILKKLQKEVKEEYFSIDEPKRNESFVGKNDFKTKEDNLPENFKDVKTLPMAKAWLYNKYHKEYGDKWFSAMSEEEHEIYDKLRNKEILKFSNFK